MRKLIIMLVTLASLLVPVAQASAADIWLTTPQNAAKHTRALSREFSTVRTACLDGSEHGGYGAAQDPYTTCGTQGWTSVYFDDGLRIDNDPYGSPAVPPPGSYSLANARCKGDPIYGSKGSYYHHLRCTVRLGPGYDVRWIGDGAWSVTYDYWQDGRTAHHVDGITLLLHGRAYTGGGYGGGYNSSGSGSGVGAVCCKTVYVRGYTKANGTVVGSYTRRAPGTAIGD